MIYEHQNFFCKEQGVPGQTYSREWGKEDWNCSEEGDEVLRRRENLPGDDGDAEYRAEDLAASDSHVLGNQTCKIRTEGDGVGSDVGSHGREVEHERTEEDGASRTGVPVAIQDRIEEVPNVPVRLPPSGLDGCGGGETEEED